MELKEYLSFYFVLDLAFSVAFCIGGLLEHKNNILVIVLIVVLAFTYYPLYAYVIESITESVIHDKSWYFKHNNSCVLYCASRIFFFLIFLVVVITDVNDAEVFHAVFNLPTLTLAFSCFMFCLLLLLVFITFKIYSLHVFKLKPTINTMTVSVNVFRDCDSAAVEERYTDLNKVVKEASYVFLKPFASADLRAQDATNLISMIDLEQR